MMITLAEFIFPEQPIPPQQVLKTLLISMGHFKCLVSKEVNTHVLYKWLDLTPQISEGGI